MTAGSARHVALEDAWIAARPAPRGARCRLFCLPYAGAGASVYRSWSAALPGVDVVAIQPPGREGRLREAALEDFDGLVAGVVGAVAPLARDLPYALFGHSLGSIVAFEVARRLSGQADRGPEHLIVGARRAPHVPNRLPLVGHLSDGEMIAVLESIFGKGIPDEVAAVPELIELLLPMLRADIRASESYAYREAPPLACPITALCGSDDASALPHEVQAWQRETTGPFTFSMVRGDHFFVRGSAAQVLRAVSRALGPLGHPAAGGRRP